MRKIYDYKDIRRLEDTSFNSILKNGLVITATSELSHAMSAYYPDYTVLDVHSFITAIIPEWEGNVKDVKNYVMLRNVIEDYVNDNEVGEESSTYLRRNAGDMWNAIKLLIEADIYPDDVDVLKSVPLRHFKNIWNNLEVENEQIMSFRSVFSFELSQREKVIEKIEDKIGTLKEDIFLLGFYFITPIQDRIFDILEKSGFNLFLLNCHDKDYKFATEIWEKTFSEEYENSEIEDIQNDYSLENYFGDALLRKINDIPIEIIKHHTEFEFAEMVKEAKDREEVLYSPDAKRCEKILKEYYPEFYNQKHLLSYPVGQYINFLHMMWNTFTNHMDLKYEYVYKCFASGWLTIDDENGRDYLYEVGLLEPYFKWCHEKAEWEKRLDHLIEVKGNIGGFVNREKGDERWHKLLGNPFNNVGIYTISGESIDAIKRLINKLIEDAEFLFAGGDRVDLYEHFQRITKIIQAHIDKEELLQEEIEIANELLLQLNDETTKGIVCPMSGIRDAIVLLIGDYFNEYETQEEETSNRERMVLPLSMVEAAMLNNYGQKIHLVLADEFNLPGQPKKLPWPLTNEMLDNLKIQEREHTRRYVKDMRAVIDNRPLAYRYLFYSFMGTSNLENKPVLSIEWICNKDKKEVDVSPYIKLLDVEDCYRDVVGKSDDYESIARNASQIENVGTITPPNADVPEEVMGDYLLCEKRYVYSYLVNYLPRFTSEFQYSFELSKLISAFTIVSGMNKNLIAEEITSLFPFLRPIELRQSTDFASSQGKPEPYIYDGIEYPGQRLLTHYLNDGLIREVRRRNDDYLNDRTISKGFVEHGCTYCPYSDVCLDRHKEEVETYEQ